MSKSRAAHQFTHDFQTAVLKALGLEGRKVKRIRLEMEVDKPITLYTEEYATFDNGDPYLIAKILQLASWEDPSGGALPSESESQQ